MAGLSLAVVTGASTGIGRALAMIAAREGYDLVVVADEPAIEAAAAEFRSEGVPVIAVQADLSCTTGVDAMLAAIGDRPVAVLCANAGTALGHAFLEQDAAQWRHVIDTNIFGTLYLLHRLLPRMIEAKGGRVLLTSSINGAIPGPFLAVYNASKAFLTSFSDALRNELQDHAELSLTTLMPGPVETPVYARAGMEETFVGATQKPAAEGVARAGWDAMLAGKDTVVPGLLNRVVEAAAHVVPAAVTAAVHRVVAEPRT